MKLRLLRGSLSAILALVICTVTVLGCFVTAGAAADLYTFNGSDINKELMAATINVVFTSPAEFDGGIYGGKFKISETNADESCLIFDSVDAVTAGVEVEAYSEVLSKGLANIVFEAPNGANEIILCFNFRLSVAPVGDKDYTVALSNVEFSNRNGKVLGDIVGADGIISYICPHTSYVDGDVINEGSCTEDRIVKTRCAECGVQGENRVIPASGHSLTYVDAKTPTCTEDGYDAYEYCSVCSYTTYNKLTATGHSKTSIAEVLPQINIDGTKAHDKCTVCGMLFIDGEPVDASELVIPALPAGWVEDGDVWYYYNEDGTKVTADWAKVNGKWYYFDADGIMQTGWVKVSGTWYYMNTSGAMQTGWQKIKNVWYYFEKSGAMVTGWQKISNVWYYFKDSGAMITGWKQLGGTWYYFKSSGAMATGWLKLGSTWYYFKSSGAMVTGTQTIDGKTYKFNSSGAWIA